MMFAAISPMIVWAVYFVTLYALQGLGCDQAWHRLLLGGTNSLTVVLAALTAVTLAVLAAQAATAWPRRAAFEGRVLFALAVFAAIATAYAGIPVVMLEPCAA